MSYADCQPVRIPRRALVRIDSNHLGNYCNPTPYKLAHLSSMLPTTERHSHPLNVQDVWLWHGTLFSCSLRHQDVMWRQPPNCNCTRKWMIELNLIEKAISVISIHSISLDCDEWTEWNDICIRNAVICTFVFWESTSVLLFRRDAIHQTPHYRVSQQWLKNASGIRVIVACHHRWRVHQCRCKTLEDFLC